MPNINLPVPLYLITKFITWLILCIKTTRMIPLNLMCEATEVCVSYRAIYWSSKSTIKFWWCLDFYFSFNWHTCTMDSLTCCHFAFITPKNSSTFAFLWFNHILLLISLCWKWKQSKFSSENNLKRWFKTV